MNIKIAGNWGAAGSNVINCESLCWVFAERELLAEIWSISTDDIRLSQKVVLFISLEMYARERKGNGFVINVHSGRAIAGVSFISLV